MSSGGGLLGRGAWGPESSLVGFLQRQYSSLIDRGFHRRRPHKFLIHLILCDCNGVIIHGGDLAEELSSPLAFINVLKFQGHFRGLLQKKGRFETYLPVGTFSTRRYVYMIFHDVIFVPNVPNSLKRTYR